jgi:hypothetical protein
MLSPRQILEDLSPITGSETALVPAPQGPQQTSPGQRPGFLVPAPQGPQHISPGQRPGIPAVPIRRALKGRDRPRRIITRSGTALVPASQGLQQFLVPAPQGPQHISPGQRPGIPAVPIGRALKGRDRPRHLAPALAQDSSPSAGVRTACAALSGQEFSRAPALPGRCPGLVCCGPCGAGSRTRGGGGCVIMPGVPGPGDYANLCLDEWVSKRMRQLRDEAAALEPQGVV